MSEELRRIQLVGQIVLKFYIETQTGLHIGAGATGIGIGTVENAVVKDPVTNMPYIPGSSLKGKMRSLAEKFFKKKLNQPIHNTYIHSCGAEYSKEELPTKGRMDFLNCEICPVFGVPGERPFAQPTRLTVRDILLSKESAQELKKLSTDLPFTEVKTEVSIDRITSQANPRSVERVPAGVLFGPGEMIYSLYTGDDCDVKRDLKLFNETLLASMDLLEKDYLGGMGSRGYGKVAFKNIKVFVRFRNEERPPFTEKKIEEFPELEKLLEKRDWLMKELERHFVKGGSNNASGGV